MSGTLGYLGVSAFFVISGFVIPLSMDKRGYVFPRDAADFAVRRLVRLEPAYLVSVTVAIAVTVLAAYSLWVLVERPTILASQRWKGGRRNRSRA